MKIEDIRTIVVVGAGGMGQEIALQCAMHGYDVVMYDVSKDALCDAKSGQDEILANFVSSGEMSRASASEAESRIRMTHEPEVAAREADLLSESIPEQVKVKRDVFETFGRLCPERTIFTTNSSFILPSQIAKATGRPAKFAGFHFHKHVWIANVVDVMPHPETSPETVRLLVDFAKRIGQIPIVVRKENYGYVFNALFEPLMFSALKLAVNGIASIEDIDRAYMGVTKSVIGLFGLMDKIGLEVSRDTTLYLNLVDRDPQRKRCAEFLQTFIDQGRLGVKSGHGFYRYPEPAFEHPDFLTGGVGSDEGPVDESGGGSPGQPAAAPKPADSPAPRMQRFVLQAVPAPLVSNVPRTPILGGAALLLGQNAAATALALQLRKLNEPVVEIPPDLNIDETIRWIDELWQSRPAPHLFLLTARDEDAASSFASDRWTARYERGVLLPFAVCQRWFELVTKSQLMESATLVAATSLGGDFGISARAAAAEGGGIAGLLKAIGMEGAQSGTAGPRIKIVDLSTDASPSFVAEALCTELALAQAAPAATTREQALLRGADAEVGYVGRARHVVRLALAPLPVASQQARHLTGQGPWVITGGGRGITGYLATELGRKFGLKLHLLGTTHLGQENYTGLSKDELNRLKSDVMKQAFRAKEKPNVAWGKIAKIIEVQSTLQTMAQAGVQAQYHACDVGSRQQLAAVLDFIRDLDGPIEGIIHGAGVEVTRQFDHKQQDVVEATLGPKFCGTLALMELTRADPLRFFIGFGSLSGRFGGALQEDYAMANDMMCKLIQWFRGQRPECFSVAIHWPAWAAIGMAARPESRFNLERIDHTLLSPPEGAAHLIAELLAAAPAGEVVFVDPEELPQAYWNAATP